MVPVCVDSTEKLPTADLFLERIQGLYRMDRGDRIYVKRHFGRWLAVAKVLFGLCGASGSLRVLDVGCGSGFFELLVGGDVVGVDNSENVAICRRRGVQACAADLIVDKLPWGNGSFDVVVCLEVLEHVAFPGNLLREVHRLLAPGGFFVVSTPNRRMPLWRIRDFVFGFKVFSRIYVNRDLGKDDVRYDKAELEKLLGLYDFEVLSFSSLRILLPADDLLVVAQTDLRS